MPDRPLSIDIKQPLLIKNGDLFLVTEQDGAVPKAPPAFGLFFRDCCYLSRYEFSLNGTGPLHLMSAWAEGFVADIELTNANLKTSNGTPIQTHVLSIKRKLLLIEDECAFVDAITFRNFSREDVELPFALTFAAGFESIFVLRGTPQGKRGAMHVPEWKNSHVRFRYSGADEILRSLDVSFSMTPVVAPRTSDNTVANFDIILASRQSKELVVSFHVNETPKRKAGAVQVLPPPTLQKLRDYQRHTSKEWLAGFTQVHSSDSVVNDILHRSLSDIRLLRLNRDGREFTAAGVPWFVGIFGRDSLIPSLQCLAFDREMAAHTACHLARRQGRKTDATRHEEPGKILHELRVGEMAGLGEIPQTPSYASIDSTLLFLILIARHAAWTGSLDLFNELRENVDRALQWMAESGDRNGDGYIEYYGKTDKGTPVNQGWKDSEDGIVREDGSFPEPPISLVEVQGYAYLAKTAIAGLYRRAGEQTTAGRLAREAEELRDQFNRDFWMEDKGCYCLGLEGEGRRRMSVVTSNAGQALWTGIADHDKALKTAQRVMQDDMFSGWGVRTLSDKEVRYNPIAYQVGSIWPFDNSLILAGFRRYGFDDFACRIFSSILDAAKRFPNGRLPEFFAGTRREAGFSPAHCPRANPLQAWSSGAVPLMVVELLGLRPNGFDGTLRIVRPVLPEPIQDVALHGIKIGSSTVDLRFARESGGGIVPHVLAIQGALKVEFEGIGEH
ncbi:MAG: glycogen debranching N-terminal domain-containing protein [Methylocella sp.]